MNTLCKKNKITKETLFEAAIIVCSNNQKILNKAIADAQKRYSNRKRIGEMKKIVNQKSGVGYRVTIKCLTTILVLEKPTPTRSAFMWEAAAQREAMGVYHINSAAR
jgi:hypothetical protein